MAAVDGLVLALLALVAQQHLIADACLAHLQLRHALAVRRPPLQQRTSTTQLRHLPSNKNLESEIKVGLDRTNR